MADLFSQALHDDAVAGIRQAMMPLDPSQKLALVRQLLTSQIEYMIDQLPVDQQRQLLAELTHQFMTSWSKHE